MRYMGYSNDTSYHSIEKLMTTLRGSFNDKPNKVKPLGEKQPYINNIKIPLNSVTPTEKSKKLIELSLSLKSYDKIIQAGATLEWEQKGANQIGYLSNGCQAVTIHVVLSAVA